MNQPLSKEILEEYGFKIQEAKSTPHRAVYEKNKVEIVVAEDGIYYSNLGFDYILRTVPDLQKLYKEIRSTSLSK